MNQLWIDKSSGKPEAVVVIMAGGSGTRFWPLSRLRRPKQFLPLAGGGTTLIQATAARFGRLKRQHTVMVVTAANQSGLVAEQLPHASILAEPEPKNTAPCLAYAAQAVLDRFGDIPIVCVPADHLIEQDRLLIGVYDAALDLVAKENVLATIGIAPTSPDTGFGYIKAGGPVQQSGARKVEQFVEKPDLATAEKYVQSGDYLWNSGMFLWRPSVFLSAVKSALPDLHAIVSNFGAALSDPAKTAEIAAKFKKIVPISVDHGVMERAENVVVFSGSGFTWSDVGSWDAWSEVAAAQSNSPENVVVGSGVAVESKRCLISTSSADGAPGPFVALVGVEDLMVISTPDAVLVCKRGESQQVKKVIDLLRERGKTDLL